MDKRLFDLDFILTDRKIGLGQIEIATGMAELNGRFALKTVFGVDSDSLNLHFDELFEKYFHPDEVDYIRKALDDAIASDTIFRAEHRVKNQITGEWRWISVAFKALRLLEEKIEYYQGIWQDIHEAKVYEHTLAEIKEADKRTKTMLDAMPICCNFWDEHYNNVDCNEAAARLFDLPDKQTYLDRFFELSPPMQPSGIPTPELALKHISQAFEEGYVRFEWMHQKLNGDPVPAEIILVRVPYGDGYIVAGYTRDLREQKAHIAAMEKVQDELRHARDTAERNALAKSEFLANMSHEIRTPMNAILGMTYLLAQTTLTEKQSNYLAKAEHSANLLLRVINDILDFSKIDAGKLTMEDIPFLLRPLVREVCDLLIDQINSKGLKLIIKIDPSAPNNITGDPIRLKQILINLLGNAIKFTHEGNITLQITSQESPKGGVYLIFTIKDSGIGMTKDQVEGLFTPFSQADTSTTRRYGGTGLGLAICKSLVNLMDGDIWCESAEGEGSTFYFTTLFLITVTKTDASALALDASLVTATKASLTGKHVLLVEDNDINQMIAVELLSARGITSDVAGNGIEALALLNKNTYDLILMDIQMPEMDGITASKRIRQDPRFTNLPIVAMTAHAMVGDRELSLASGMNDHITKPIDPEELYTIIIKYTAKKN